MINLIFENFGWILGIPIMSIFVFLRYAFFAGLVFVPLYVLFSKRLSDFKIQNKVPRSKRIREEVLHSGISAAIYGLVGLFIYLMVNKGWTQIYTDVETFGSWYIPASIVVLLFIHDTYFYWLHRWMHLPGVYKWLHIEHHRSHNPTPWAALTFDPLEALLEIAILPIIVLVMPLHPIALFAFTTISLMWNVIGHSGYEFFPKNFVRHPIGKWFNTATHHNMHHRRANGNYGLYFNIWDRWMGTNHADYETQFDKIKARASTASKSHFSSKKIQRTMQKHWKFFTLIAVLFTLASCETEPTEEMPQEEAVQMTEEEAVEIVSAALTTDTQGIAKEVEEVEEAADVYALESNCGLEGDSTFTYSVNRPNVSGAYTVSYQWQVICEGLLPSIFKIEHQTSGQYETLRMKSDDIAGSTWKLENLIAGEHYNLSGTYERSGTQQTNFQEEKSFETELIIQVPDLSVDKQSGEILNGFAEFVLTGSSSSGTAIDHTGAIQFLGNQSANITINGNTYTINW